MQLKDYVKVFEPEIESVLIEKLNSLEKELAYDRAVITALHDIYKEPFAEFLRNSKYYSYEYQTIYEVFLEVNFYFVFSSVKRLTQEIKRVKRAMMYLSKEKGFKIDLETIKEECLIEDFYNGELKREGSRWKGVCPFHDEDTPSFFIFTKNNSFYCFGCGKGGSIIDFVAYNDGLSVPEAIKKLSNLT